MRSWRALLDSVHIVALALWLGALVMTGITAAITFPTMRGLDPRLPGFEAYTGEHWLIAGGHIMQRVFLACDVIAFACALLAVGAFLAGLIFIGRPPGRGSLGVRALALGVALAALAGQLVVLAPSMNAALTAYWDAARAGDMPTALHHKEAFDASHPIASFVLSAGVLGVLAALIGAAWSLSAGSDRTPGPAAASPKKTRLEEPMLGRRPR